MRVALDIDNVTVAWQDAWIDRYQGWFDREVDHTRTGEWDAMLSATHFETHGQFWSWFQRAGVWDAIDYVPGAEAGIEWIQDQGHRFLFVTARPPHGVESAVRLARTHGVPVTFLNDQSKHLAKADIWIDDSPGVLANLADYGKSSVRLERPWNEGAPATFSALHWPGIITILKGIS